MTWIQTLTGKKFDLLDPNPDDVDLMDIAVSLANTPRFNGQTWQHYSVAEHSILVAHWLPERLKFAGLMHDAAEAYVGDMVTPLKRELGRFSDIEARILWAIFEHCGVRMPASSGWALVKLRDTHVYVAERRQLFANPIPEPLVPDPVSCISENTKIECWEREEACERWLAEFVVLLSREKRREATCQS